MTLMDHAGKNVAKLILNYRYVYGEKIMSLAVRRKKISRSNILAFVV